MMGKLVRDRIPKIIKSDGKTPIIEILSNEDYLEELLQVRESKREKRGGFKDKIYWVGNEE